MQAALLGLHPRTVTDVSSRQSRPDGRSAAHPRQSGRYDIFQASCSGDCCFRFWIWEITWPQEQFDACIALCELSARRASARAAAEWRLTLSLWAVLTASISYFRAEALPIWAGLAILVLHASFLYSAWLRSAKGAEMVWNFTNEAQRILAELKIRVIRADGSLRIGEHEPKWLPNQIRFLKC